MIDEINTEIRKHNLTAGQKVYSVIKRIIDFTICAIAGIVLAPIMLILVIAVKIDSKGPVFFKQRRIGKNKKEFYIWKLRTMRTDTPKNMPTHLLENPDQYITRTGRFLRKLSLDELPQIYQVCFQKLALVGPRPALWNQYDLIAERDQYGANDILPGITGWAQVNGRDELEIEDKARLDGEYCKRMSFAMDVRCLVKTVIAVVKHDGVVEGGTGEMKKKAEEEAVNK